MNRYHERTLMAVLAHAGDEAIHTGGTLAIYAAAGFRTVLVVCTGSGSGPAREPSFPRLPGTPNPAYIRALELRQSAAAIELSELIELNYRSSDTSTTGQTLQSEPFSSLDVSTLAVSLDSLLDKLRPEVVITHPPNSANSDERQAHAMVTTAVTRVDQRPGDSAFAAPTVYYPTTFGANGWGASDSPASAFGPSRRSADVSIDISGFRRRKQQALAAYETHRRILALLDSYDGPGVQTAEHYLRADARTATTPGLTNSDLFAKTSVTVAHHL